jgi:peptidoglycan/LPS O-acetylase OafA/YrhL
MTAGLGRSLEHRMIETGGRATGFDYLRVLLACAVIIWHAFGVTRGMPFTFKVEDSPFRPLIMAILPMFFGLSGFLVAGSLFRNSAISTFLGLRAIRIFPALAVESLFSAWIIG